MDVLLSMSSRLLSYHNGCTVEYVITFVIIMDVLLSMSSRLLSYHNGCTVEYVITFVIIS